MTAELLNKIIKYLISQPYKDVYDLMEEIKEVVKKLQNAQIEEVTEEETKNAK